jgi:phytoene synthase
LHLLALTHKKIKNSPDRGRLRSLLTMEADRARDFYKSGHELIPLVNEDSQPALWVLVTVYQRLLEKMAQKQYDVYARFDSTFEKVSFLGKVFLMRLM